MTTTGGCNRRVSLDSWHFADCGKPVKDEGLCARHLAGKKRGDAALAKSTERYNASLNAQRQAVAVGASLSTYGITSQAHYDYEAHGYTGKVVVDGEEVLKALKEPR